MLTVVKLNTGWSAELLILQPTRNFVLENHKRKPLWPEQTAMDLSELVLAWAIGEETLKRASSGKTGIIMVFLLLSNSFRSSMNVYFFSIRSWWCSQSCHMPC
jgi:hypothetical protein